MTALAAAVATPVSSSCAALAELVGICGRQFRAAYAEAVAAHALTETQFSVLWACREAPADGLGQNQLALRLALSPAQVSVLVEQLSAAQLIAARRSPLDRRRQFWRLTDLGAVRLEAAAAAVEAALRVRVSDERRPALVALASALASLGVEPSAPPASSSEFPRVFPDRASEDLP